MSILSNINVGVNFRKQRNNLSQDTHTTAEIGYFQPTFCRELVPKSHVRISAKSLVRLSAMAVPTMGRISLRHYFAFADYATLWFPFESFRTGNNYAYANGTTSVPLSVPYFTIFEMLAFAFQSSYLASQLKIHRFCYCTVYKNGTVISGTNLTSELSVCQTNFDTNRIPTLPAFYLQQANGNGLRMNSKTSTTVTLAANTGDTSLMGYPMVTNKNADFSFKVSSGSDVYMFLCKFTPMGKRLRKHFIGVGNSFNPFDKQEITPLKLFAVYKMWFDKFAVQRKINFNNTNCYASIKYISENPPVVALQPNMFNSTTGYSSTLSLYFVNFLEDLAELCYVLPPDYFSASDTSMSRGAQPVVSLQSPNYMTTTPSKTDVIAGTPQDPASAVNTGTTELTAGMVEGVLRVARFINKRTVAGRKISQLLKLDGESDVHNFSHESVHHLGASKVDVQISDVMSLADTSTASLGDFAGRGIGFKDSDTFVYDSPCTGVLICLTAVVPTSGYFQGILKENTQRNRFDFWTEDFDAVGYQSIAMNELVSDFQFDKSSGSNPLGTQLGYFGLTPRYQHLRIGRNICNGDISCPSTQAVMLPYNLDRHFITYSPSDSNNYDFKDVSVPSIYPETFREVKADSGYGDYNRIFQYMSNDFDHFIIHLVFDCPILSPMKSVANSYDTFQDDDNKSLEFKHE